MDGAAFILAINLSIAGLVAAAFLAVGLFSTGYVAARWFAIAYAVGMVNIALEAAIPFTQDYRPYLTLAYAAFLAALAIFNVGLARLYSVRVPWAAMGAIFVVSVVMQMAMQDLPRDSLARMVFYQLPYFVMQGLSAAIVMAAPAKRRLDVVLVGLLGASAVHFLAKPFMAAGFGGMGDSPKTYLATTYALFSQSLGSFFAIAVALLVLVILLKQLLEELTARSRTDPLSGVLNRAGFNARLDDILSAKEEGGPPVSLVICDLDHFKAVNDTHGHAVGDSVIVAFARTLCAAAGRDDAVGRIGGEEFAVVLPACNLASARLFAETVRHTFAGLPVEGVPDDMRLTASFGVAELRGGETVSDVLGRADRALYRAKADGRDCVRIALEAEAAAPTLVRRANRD